MTGTYHNKYMRTAGFDLFCFRFSFFVVIALGTDLVTNN